MSIEQRVSKMERKVSTVEDAIKLLSQLVASHDDRLFDSLKKDEDLSAKITILIDAQIRSEDKIQNIDEDLKAKIAILIDAQIRSEDKIQNINVALDKLTELVKTAHSRIDRLES